MQHIQQQQLVASRVSFDSDRQNKSFYQFNFPFLVVVCHKCGEILITSQIIYKGKQTKIKERRVSPIHSEIRKIVEFILIPFS